MARVTVEDCIERVKNRFELILLAAKRSRDLKLGMPPTLSKDNDKNPIIALREIAEDTISLDALKKGAKIMFGAPELDEANTLQTTAESAFNQELIYVEDEDEDDDLSEEEEEILAEADIDQDPVLESGIDLDLEEAKNQMGLSSDDEDF